MDRCRERSRRSTHKATCRRRRSTALGRSSRDGGGRPVWVEPTPPAQATRPVRSQRWNGVMTRLLAVGVGVCASLLVALTICATAASAASPPTAMCTIGGVTQPCVSPGWYTGPVTLTWSPNGSNFTGGLRSPHVQRGHCRIGGADLQPIERVPVPGSPTTSGMVSGTVTSWVDVEVSAPAAVATPSRPPDANGWYNHRCRSGSVAARSQRSARAPRLRPPGGPATSSTTLTGSCIDNAGKTAVGSFNIAYDATPPTVTLQPG